jgi:hypothetical protein
LVGARPAPWLKLRAVVRAHGGGEASARHRGRSAGGAALGHLDDANVGLRTFEGEEFLKRYFPDTAEQSTRSEVILAMAKEIHAGRATSTGGIFMDATKVPMEVIQKQIPHVYKTCLHRHIDISKTPFHGRGWLH